MSKTADTVAMLAAPVVEGLGLSLWDVEFVKEGGSWVLRVVIDKSDGVSMDDCESVSRALDPILDAEDPIEQSYTLEVCSAGVERALKRPSDFEKFINHKVEVKLFSAQLGAKEHIGILTAYDGDMLYIDNDKSFPVKNLAMVRLRIF